MGSLMMAGGLGCRKVDLVEHTVEELMVPRVYGLALGYEDLHDHERDSSISCRRC